MDSTTRKRKVDEDVLAEDRAAEVTKKVKETTGENAPAPPQQDIAKPPNPIVTGNNGTEPTDKKAEEPGTLKTGGDDADDGPSEKNDSGIKDKPAEEVRKEEQQQPPTTTKPSDPTAAVPADEQLDDKKIIQDTSELPPSYVGRVIGKGELYWAVGCDGSLLAQPDSSRLNKFKEGK